MELHVGYLTRTARKAKAECNSDIAWRAFSRQPLPPPTIEAEVALHLTHRPSVGRVSRAAILKQSARAPVAAAKHTPKISEMMKK